MVRRGRLRIPRFYGVAARSQEASGVDDCARVEGAILARRMVWRIVLLAMQEKVLVPSDELFCRRIVQLTRLKRMPAREKARISQLVRCPGPLVESCSLVADRMRPI